MTAAFADLRKKYEEMLALRLLDDPSHDPRPRLAALASRFPGALREIDDLAESEIARRIDALSRAERDPAAATPWMHAMTRFHALARGVLFAKRSLASPRSAPAAPAAPAEWPDEAFPFRDDPRVAAPPRGRLMDLVYEKLAAELGTTPTDAKRLIFPSSRER